MKKSILKRLASEHQERLARKLREAEKAPPDPLQHLSAAVQAWEDATWPDVAARENREPTAAERKAAKVPALLMIREALGRLGPKVKDGLLSAPAADPGRTYALALLFEVKPKDITAELPVPKRLEHDPIYTPIDEWISGKLLVEVGALLPKDGPKEPLRVSNTSAPTTAGPTVGIKLSPSEQTIVNVIRQAGRRLTTNQILTELEKTRGATSTGTTKTSLAHLTRTGVLTNRRDTNPPGYGLPEWA